MNRPIVVLVLLVIGVSFLQAGEPVLVKERIDPALVSPRALFLLNADGTANGGIMVAQENPSKKNKTLAVVASALVPGTGEMYAGSWIKGAVILGVEAALWTGYFLFSGKGNDLEDEFHLFADTHWSEGEWRSWMNENPTYGDTTHTLPSTKTQQYYEMIGKYNQFKAGWDDFVDGGPSLTENRNHYENIRNDSNVQLKNASYCAMAALLNHLFSALDAAWTVRGFNRKIESGLQVGMKHVRDRQVPVLSLTLQW